MSLGGYAETGFLVRFTVLVSAKGLMIGSYSDYQPPLSDLVIQLRDDFWLTFKGVAEELIKNGYRSPRGFDLGPESVFRF